MDRQKRKKSVFRCGGRYRPYRHRQEFCSDYYLHRSDQRRSVFSGGSRRSLLSYFTLSFCLLFLAVALLVANWYLPTLSEKEGQVLGVTEVKQFSFPDVYTDPLLITTRFGELFISPIDAEPAVRRQDVGQSVYEQAYLDTNVYLYAGQKKITEKIKLEKTGHPLVFTYQFSGPTGKLAATAGGPGRFDIFSVEDSTGKRRMLLEVNYSLTDWQGRELPVNVVSWQSVGNQFSWQLDKTSLPAENYPYLLEINYHP